MKIRFLNFYVVNVWLFLFQLILSFQNDDDKFINEFVVHCPGGYSEAKSLAIQMGFVLDHKMMGLDDFYIFKHKSKIFKKSKFHTHRLKRSTKVNWVEQQKLLKRVKRDFSTNNVPVNFIDPLFNSQWYLTRSQRNSDDTDMNVNEAWQLGYTGKNIVISILDDGIDYRHDDLKDNYDAYASYDINGNDYDPLPNLKVMENRHGTRCAGEVSAKANNSMCGVGVAFGSRIGAVRMLDGEVTDRVEAEALSYKQQHIDIYSGSWGPDDNGQQVEGPAKLAKAAFEKGTKYGRKGLGNIYVWASGNGGKKFDSCACDGYASSIYTVSISSVSELNLKPWYLESCASTIASTYSSGSKNEKKIISTDLNNSCALDHTGTSASAPLAAGIIALLLEANQKLTWRDVQYIIVVTANSKPFIKGEFIVNGANRKVSNWYGFGLMDTGKIVRLGRLWHTLSSQHVCTAVQDKNKKYLKDLFKVSLSIKTDGCPGENKINYIEHVILYLNIEYQRRGDLRIHLISPKGTRSKILPYRPFDFKTGATTFDLWPLMSVQFWGESAEGVWTVEIDNSKTKNKKLKGSWASFKLEFYGTEKWPVRLKSPSTNEKDIWFQRFERFVVESTDEDIPINSPISRRGYTDTSSDESIMENTGCDDECFNNTCNGKGPQNCVSCNNYQTQNGVCVSKCPLGQYQDNNTKICEPCHYSCDECIGPGKLNCSRCHVGDISVVNIGQCKMSLYDCPRGQFKDLNICRPCPANCLSCVSNDQCSECDNSFVLTLQSQCRSKCDIGSYPNFRQRCQVCHTSCLACSKGGASSCTSCAYKYFIKFPTMDTSSGQCVSKCPYGYFTNNTIRFCYRCHINCKTCTGPSPKMCIDCLPPLELSTKDHSCIDPVTYNCKPDEFKSATGTCEKCPPQCKTCSANRCTSCPTNKFHFNKTCVTHCPIGNFLLSGLDTCLPCDEHCYSCNNSVNIRECFNCSQKLDTCSHNCLNGQYWNITKKNCQKCHSTCATCQGSTDHNCTSCVQNNHMIFFNKCVGKCPLGKFSFQFFNQRRCIFCHPSCHNETCNPDDGKCLNCSHGHRLSANGFCERIITCSMSEYWQNEQNLCVKCDLSCRSCSEKKLCTSCHRNSCLDPQLSICRPCCSPYSANKNCAKCLFGHELCISENQLKTPSMTLLIFRYPVRIIFLVSVAFILLFVMIILYFYAGDIFGYFNGNYSKSSVKYKKLQNLPDLSDDNDNLCSSSDEHDASEGKVIFKSAKVSFSKSMKLEVVDETTDEANNSSLINMHSKTMNGHVIAEN